jgi:hypothetical protein
MYIWSEYRQSELFLPWARPFLSVKQCGVEGDGKNDDTRSSWLISLTQLAKSGHQVIRPDRLIATKSHHCAYSQILGFVRIVPEYFCAHRMTFLGDCVRSLTGS